MIEGLLAMVPLKDTEELNEIVPPLTLEELDELALKLWIEHLNHSGPPPTWAQLADFVNQEAPEEAREAAADVMAEVWPHPAARYRRLAGITGDQLVFESTKFGHVNGESIEQSRHFPCGLTVRVGVVRHLYNHMSPRPDVFPLTPVLAAWPVFRAPNLRSDRILPNALAMVEPTDSRAGRLFRPAAHRKPDGQGVLPGFGETDPLTPALPLALYDLGVGVESRSPAAPLALRLFIEAVLAVGIAERQADRPVAIDVTLRDLLDRLYPKHRPNPAKYWPRLVAAADAIDTGPRIPWYDPESRRGGMRRVVTVGDIPRGPHALDDLVRLVVDLPPGAALGPIVTPTLGNWGARSAPAYRLLLNLAYRWFVPGMTRVPRRRGGPWRQVDDPHRYMPVATSELRRLAFPTSTTRNTRVLDQRARETLHRLEKADELRTVDAGLDGLRILPPRRL